MDFIYRYIMEDEYGPEEGLALLAYLGISLDLPEDIIFVGKWSSFYSTAEPLKKDPSYKALSAAYSLASGVGILTDDPSITLFRELHLDHAIEATGLLKKLENGLFLRDIIREKRR